MTTVWTENAVEGGFSMRCRAVNDLGQRCRYMRTQQHEHRATATDEATAADG